MSSAWYKRPETIIAATALFGVAWAIFVWFSPGSLVTPAPPPSAPPPLAPRMYAVATLSTRSLPEAKRHAKDFSRRHHGDVEIRRSPNGFYAVIVGIYEFDKADNLKNEGISTGSLPEDAYLIEYDLLLAKVDYADFDDHRFIRAGSFSTKERAFSRSDELNQLGYKSEVYLTEDGFYVIVLGRWLQNAATRLRVRAIDSGHIDEDSFLTVGKDHVRKLERSAPPINDLQPSPPLLRQTYESVSESTDLLEE